MILVGYEYTAGHKLEGRLYSNPLSYEAYWQALDKLLTSSVTNLRRLLWE